MPTAALRRLTKRVLATSPRGTPRLAPPALRGLASRPPLQQEAAERLLVCLDLDECLVHCEVPDPTAKGCWRAHGDLSSKPRLVRVPCREFTLQHVHQPVRVFLRPHVETFLEEASAIAQLVLFTSASEEYALRLAQILDPERKYFSHMLSRKQCTQLDPGVYLKDISQLRHSLARTILVDDTKTSFLLQPDNGIPCRPFFGDHRDVTLLSSLLPTIRHLATLADVRPYLRQQFDLQARLRLLAHLRNLTTIPRVWPNGSSLPKAQAIPLSGGYDK